MVGLYFLGFAELDTANSTQRLISRYYSCEFFNATDSIFLACGENDGRRKKRVTTWPLKPNLSLEQVV
jgi:hypothetical protein